jgi:hypothetical protein
MMRWGETMSPCLCETEAADGHVVHLPVNMEYRRSDADSGKLKDSEKSCPSATLSTTNPTWILAGRKMNLCGEKPATNRPCYGAAY